MFDIGKIYWFRFKGDVKEIATVRGEVLEENGFLIKIRRDNGNIEFICLSALLGANEERKEKK
jgi:hypothetical protein